jgi:hypothetical protein
MITGNSFFALSQRTVPSAFLPVSFHIDIATDTLHRTEQQRNRESRYPQVILAFDAVNDDDYTHSGNDHGQCKIDLLFHRLS